MTSETTYIAEFDLTKWKESNNAFHKLENAMTHLIFAGDLDEDLNKTSEVLQNIMQHLQDEYKKEEKLYLPWVRFFDVIGHGLQSAFELEPNLKGTMETLVLELLTQGSTIKAIDWRIAKKILGIPHVFLPGKKSRLLPLISKEDLLKAFQQEIETAFEDLVWVPSNSLTRTAKDALKKLQECFNDESFHDRLIQALTIGRFDKTIFGLSHTLICGEDGGLVLLLNRLSKEQQEDMVKGSIVTKDYLQDKIKNNEKKGDSTNDRVVIGAGGFGTVRFGLNLFRESKVRPGDIICIKKTKDLTHVAKNLVPTFYGEAEWANIDESEKETCLLAAANGITGPTLRIILAAVLPTKSTLLISLI